MLTIYGRKAPSIYWRWYLLAASLSSFMPNFATATGPDVTAIPGNGSTRHIVGFVYFTFVCYLSIGLPLAVLPPYVHFRMGFSAALAGLVISIQYIATLVSRPWAGRISDRSGAKVSVLWGMATCTTSGVLLVAAALLLHTPWLSISILILSRLVLGVGESLGSTGSTLWGITSAGPQHTAKVISFNGISTYGGLALGAPLGVVLDSRWGLASIGLLTILIGAVSVAVAFRKSPVPVAAGEHLPFTHVFGRVAPHGMGLALGGVGYSVLATFVTLFYVSRHWDGAALCLTSFGMAFILARLLFIGAIERFGGFRVAMVCLSVESLGTILLWRAPSPWVALAGAALAGFGFSLVFPALGVEAVKRVAENNRGTALGVYTAFADVSFFLTGPLAGAVIGLYGYSSVFLFALISVLTSLGIVIVLRQFQKD
jgi:MFS family permease